MKAIVFGTGKQFELHKHIIWADFEVVGLVDNDMRKWGSVIEGIEVKSVESIFEMEYDVVVVAMQTHNSLEARRQLEKMGISCEKMRFYAPCGVYPYRIPEDFFCEELSNEDKKKIFATNVERVVIEVNSKCNRQCWYCPNSFVDRHSKNIEMDDGLFSKVIDQLKEIDYQYELSFSYYNEPLCSEKILDRIKEAKTKLPNVHIYIFTNGDYLNQDMLNNLSEAGLDSLRVDLYPDSKPGEYTRRAAMQLVDRFIKKNKLIPDYQLTCENDISTSIVARAKINSMEIEFNTRDFTIEAKNRAESLPNDIPIPPKVKRKHPCFKSFMSFHIAYNGNVYPCPNMHTDVNKHQEYCVGNVYDSSIFDIFVGKALMEFREKNLFHRDTLPCRSCTWFFTSFIENRYCRPFKDSPC